MHFAQYVTELRNEIRKSLGCDSVHLRTELVQVVESDAVVWEGNVECFALLQCAAGAQCYGWSVQQGDGTTAYVVMLHKPPVNSAQRAIQVWLLDRG